MSQPQEEREFKVMITVSDGQGNTLNRNFVYSQSTDYSAQVADLVETFLETENI